jgi:hypothetical protein
LVSFVAKRAVWGLIKFIRFRAKDNHERIIYIEVAERLMFSTEN